MKSLTILNLDWNFVMANNIVLGKGFEAIYRDEAHNPDSNIES
jgi:hypothetical protein